MSENNYGKITAIVTSYFIVSISLVFVNKLLMGDEKLKDASIPAPLFVTWFQCAMTAAIIGVLGLLGKGQPSTSFFGQFPAPAYDLPTAMKVMKLSVMFVAMITFNNLCLKYVEVSFYNVARSLTIVFNVIFTFFMLGEKTSNRVMGCLFVVIIGFFVGAEGEVALSLKGTLYGVLSSVFVSLNSIYTKKVNDVVQNNQWRLAYYNNVNACLLFLPFMYLSDEFSVLQEYYSILVSGKYWFVMSIAGMFGFLINIIVVMQITNTSPLTHNISGTAKACVQTVLAVMIWQNPMTVNAWLGVVLVIAGSFLYAWVRMQENEAAKKQQQDKAKQKLMSLQEEDTDNDDLELGSGSINTRR